MNGKYMAQYRQDAPEWPARRPHKRYSNANPERSRAILGPMGMGLGVSIYIQYAGVLFQPQYPVSGGWHDLLRHPEAPPPPRPLCHPQKARAVVSP